MVRWNLDYPWVEETALATLDSSRDEGVRPFQLWQFVGFALRYPFYPGEVRSSAAQALARQSGVRPAPLSDATNFEALARYQVLRESHSQIAECMNLVRQSVSEAISRGAKLTDIEKRRRGKPGRPPKKAGKTPN